VIYLDGSALVKLVFEEAESNALTQWLTEQGNTPKISSQVSTIELVRTCRRHDEGAISAARQVLAGLDLLPMTTDLVEQASLVGPPELRSLAAIHLSSVLSVKDDVIAFVVYDSRLRSAAVAAGVAVANPA
jgi:uncharacterized protein